MHRDFRRLLCFALLCLPAVIAAAQEADSALIGRRLDAQREGTEPTRAARRTYNPVKLVFYGTLGIYRSVLSEQVAAVCGFDRSCSAFAGDAIAEFGTVKGLCLAADRLTRCNGTAQYGAAGHLVNHSSGKTIDEAYMYRRRALQQESSLRPAALLSPGMMERRWPAHDTAAVPPALEELRRQYLAAPHYSAFRAGLYSALLPGLGKLYLRSPEQALTAFLANALLAAQAAESYGRAGPGSARFIVTASFSGVFYAGNVWGSALLAGKKRKDDLDAIDHEVRRYHAVLRGSMASEAGPADTSLDARLPAPEMQVQASASPAAAIGREREYALMRLTALNETQRWEACRRELLEWCAGGDSALAAGIAALPVAFVPVSAESCRRLSTFVPGLGQARAGYALKGLTSLTLQAAAAAFAAWNFSEKYYVTGTVSGLLPLLKLYGGGRRLAASLAAQRNAREAAALRSRYAAAIRAAVYGTL